MSSLTQLIRRKLATPPLPNAEYATDDSGRIVLSVGENCAISEQRDLLTVSSQQPTKRSEKTAGRWP